MICSLANRAQEVWSSTNSGNVPSAPNLCGCSSLAHHHLFKNAMRQSTVRAGNNRINHQPLLHKLQMCYKGETGWESVAASLQTNLETSNIIRKMRPSETTSGSSKGLFHSWGGRPLLPPLMLIGLRCITRARPLPPETERITTPKHGTIYHIHGSCIRDAQEGITVHN